MAYEVVVLTIAYRQDAIATRFARFGKHVFDRKSLMVPTMEAEDVAMKTPCCQSGAAA